MRVHLCLYGDDAHLFIKTPRSQCKRRPASTETAMSELKRKRARRAAGALKHHKYTNGGCVTPLRQTSRSKLSGSETAVGTTQRYMRTAHLVFGLVLAAYLSYVYAGYGKQLHENELWFSHITQLEREISFRTEAGFYYSYYKQLVEAPSLMEGIRGLLRDNQTESGKTINVLHRFNVFQEVLLGTAYRLLPLKGTMEPIFFYINVVFGLHGAYAAALFGMAWFLSDSVLGGILTFLLFLFNREDATRLEVAIPLRESFALPFISLQLLLTILFLRQRNGTKTQLVLLVLVFLCSLCVAMTWQFAQFIFLLEGLSLFATHLIGAAPRNKVWWLVLCHALSLLVVFPLQFFNTMLLGSLAISFTLALSVVFAVQAVTSIRCRAEETMEADSYSLPSSSFIDPVRNLFKAAISTSAVIALTLGISMILKSALRISDDDHILKFIAAKLGWSTSSDHDLDTLLYLCQGAFQALPTAILFRLTSSLLLPLYLLTVMAVLPLTLHHLCTSTDTGKSQEGGASRAIEEDLRHTPSPLPLHLTSKPPPSTSSAWVYTIILSLSFGVVAMTTVRFKYLWVPYMCVVVGGGVSHFRTWRALSERLGLPEWKGDVLRLVSLGALIVTLLLKELPKVLSQLAELREFYDPDTVELMNWIISDTPAQAVFAGSMQLLAGVKLCTQRPITNHPHFENKDLRERTAQVYQVYAQQSPVIVHGNLVSLGADFVILEDSICQASRDCSLPAIMDSVNGHSSSTSKTGHSGSTSKTGPEDAPRGHQKSQKVKWQRFCDVVRYGRTRYSKYFTPVFENRTFRVYKLRSVSR